MNTKSLILAGFAIVSLSAGAMAQEGGGPSMRTLGYWDHVVQTQLQANAAATARIQAGAPDVEKMGLGGIEMRHPDYTTMANPG